MYALHAIDYPVHVRLVWTVPDNRVRDSSGPDPTLKAAQDGLVKCGLIADDRHEFVSRSYCVIEKGDKYAMRLEIEAA
jgi:Holliday junction resolvase RusA-like endonuclease